MKFNNIDFDTYLKNYPDKDGYFGKFGGSFISEVLNTAMLEISDSYYTICLSRIFFCEFWRFR